MPNTPPDLSVIYKDTSQLKPYERNARTHNRKQIRQIANSIKSFGFTNPILLNEEGMILAGHGRLEAAKQLGMAKVPTIQLGHLSQDQIRAYILADNKIAEQAGWDKDTLAIELQHLLTVEGDLDITLTGFELPEIELIIGGEQDDDVGDQVEAPCDTVVSRKGDLWLLGKHRVLCGDSTLPDCFDKLMNNQKATMTFTDPPYNVDYGKGKSNKHRPIMNDALGEGFGSFLLAACQNILNHTDGAAYICMACAELHVLQAAFIKAGGHWSTFLIWAKNTFTIGRSDYQRQYEPILYGWREGTKRKWIGSRDQGDVWFYDKPARNDVHPTMKPVGLAMRAIRNSSDRGDIVLDPFLGSGTTLIGAERTKRACYGIELDPLYVDVIIRRWEKQTGQKARLAETNQTIEEVTKAREAE